MLAAICAQHMLAFGEHGDDDFDIAHGFLPRCGRCHAGLSGGMHGLPGQVKSGDAVIGFGQVPGHAHSHVSQTDNRDLHETS